jgi:cytochrome P450
MHNAAQDQQRVSWSEQLGGWSVSSYELVRIALEQPRRFSSEGNEIARNLAGEAMLVTDSAVHGAVRALWAKPFSAPVVAARRRELERLALGILAPPGDQLRSGETVDLVPLFEAFAGKVVLSLLNLTGTTEADFHRWYKLVLDSAAFSITPESPLYRERTKAKAEIYAMLEDEVENRLARLGAGEAGSDLVFLIAASEGRNGISRAVILDNLFNVFTGGADTTVRWMGNAVDILARHPDALAELRANPALLPQALEEVMRFRSVTRFAIRTVCEDGVELGGQPMRRGDTVYLLTSAANHDPSVFDQPERFDIHRKARPHLGFSHGMHKCIGINLARVEAQAFLGEMLASFPDFEIVALENGDESVVRGPEKLVVRQASSGRS